MAGALAKYRSTRPDGKLHDQVRALLGKSRAIAGSPAPKTANKTAATLPERKSSPLTPAPTKVARPEPAGRQTRPLLLAILSALVVLAAALWLWSYS